MSTDAPHMSTAELKVETTLAAASMNPDARAHFLTFAVIVDISEALKFEKGSNYVVRLKVVDPSFNYKAKIESKGLKFFKFCHVNIYLERPEDAPHVQCIGDIVRLRRFKFRITDKGELQAIEQVSFSNWLIYSGDRKASHALLSYKKGYQKNTNRQTTPYEAGRIDDLREWAYEFFSRSSLRYIIWWNDLPAATEPGTRAVDHADVDLILKVSKVLAAQKRIAFIDSENNKYSLVMGSRASAPVGVVVKMRCVNVRCPKSGANDVREITLTEKSSCLYLRDFFRDALCFDVERRKLVGKDLYLLEFNNAATAPFVTNTKRLHNGLKRSTAGSLLALLGREPAMHQNEKFIFEGRVAGFASTEPQDIIRKQVDKFEGSVPFATKTPKKYQVIYHLALQLQDDSAKEGLCAYLTTSSDSYYVFDAWKLLPPTKDNAAWDAIKPAQLAAFSAKLRALAAKGCRVRLVLQLLLTASQKPFFKVIDTLFTEF